MQNGWIPNDPREADGVCGAVSPFVGPITPPSRTGGAGAGTIEAGWVASYSAWPPASVMGAGGPAAYAAYTATGPMITLPVPTFTKPGNPKETIAAGSGWTSSGDTKLNVEVSGCTYPDAWTDTGSLPACAAIAGAAAGAPGPAPVTRTKSATPEVTDPAKKVTRDKRARGGAVLPKITPAPRV